LHSSWQSNPYTCEWDTLPPSILPLPMGMWIPI